MMMADRLSEAAVDVGTDHSQPSRRRRVVVLCVAIATDPQETAPGDRGLEMRWREIRATLIDPQIAGHLGEIVRAGVTGLIVEFGNAVNAVRCAVEMQRDAQAANAGPGRTAPIELRIGVHALESGDHGPELNAGAIGLARRLESAAEAGQILLSAETAAQVAGAPDLVTERLSEPPPACMPDGEPVFR